MKKILLCLLAIPLFLSACGGQTAPEVASSQTAETSALAELPENTPMIVRLTNTSTSATLSMGVFATHNDRKLINPSKDEVKPALTSLAQNSTQPFANYVRELKSVETVFEMPVGLAPGETYAFQITPEDSPKFISGLMMNGESHLLLDSAPFEPGSQTVGDLQVVIEPRNY